MQKPSASSKCTEILFLILWNKIWSGFDKERLICNNCCPKKQGWELSLQQASHLPAAVVLPAPHLLLNESKEAGRRYIQSIPLGGLGFFIPEGEVTLMGHHQSKWVSHLPKALKGSSSHLQASASRRGLCYGLGLLGGGSFLAPPQSFWNFLAGSSTFCLFLFCGGCEVLAEGGAALRERRGLSVLGSLLKLSDSSVAVAVADCSQKVFSQPMGFSLHVAQTSWVLSH